MKRDFIKTTVLSRFMQTTFRVSSLPLLEKLIEYTPPTVAPETTVWDTIALMNKYQPPAQRVLVVENKRVVGLFSWEDVLSVVESEINLKSTQITEVMTTSAIKLKYSHLQDIKSIFALLNQTKVPILIEDRKEQLFGYIAPENITPFLLEEYQLRITTEHIKNKNKKIISEILPSEKTTEIKELETLLYVQQAVESNSEAIIITNLTGNIIYLNTSFAKKFNYTLEELNELGGLSFLWKNVEKYQELLASIKQGKYWCNELEIKSDCGDVFYMNSRTYPVKDFTGKIIGMLSIYHTDLTEEVKAQQILRLKVNESKQHQEDLKQALEKEKELNKLKNNFISMTSHEFRTPLSTILSSSELLENYQHKWEEEKKLKHFTRIKRAVQHMNNLLNDVLFFGKAEARKIDCDPSLLDLVGYSKEVIEDVQINQIINAINLSDINTDINTDIKINFINNETRLIGKIDEKMLRHILNNLLSNAIKYSKPGTTVNFTLSSQQGRAVFEIEDEGIGIPSEDLPFLFDSFHRCNNVENIQGTGLGLSIVKKCVDMLQGEINVTTEVGVGTKFTIIIPLGSCCNK